MRPRVLLFIACCLLLLTGCPRQPVLLGTVKGLVKDDVAAVHAATLDLLRNSEPMVEQESCDAKRGLIQARYGDGVAATIDIQRLTEEVCTVAILIGDRGDRVAAGHLLDRIQQAVENGVRKP